MPRLYREAPVNSIWEGAGNIMCLDVLRALERMPGAVELLSREIDEAVHADKRLQVLARRLQHKLTGHEGRDEAQARAIVRDLVLAVQSALLLRHAPTPVADAFCASRLSDEPGGTFGLLSTGADPRAIVDRAAARAA
jgi:putative acyl-CoA dehydrogenase